MRALFLGLLITALLACGAEESAVVENQPANSTEAAAELNRLAEAYFEEKLKLDPFNAPAIGDYRFNDQFGNPISDTHIRAAESIAKQYLAALKHLPRTALDAQSQITYDVMLWEIERELAGRVFPNELLPINQFYNRINSFARLGSGEDAQPFRSIEDYDAFLKKISGFSLWVDSAIMRMREGIHKRIVLPRVLAEKLLPQLAAHIVEKPEQSLYWQPIERMPADFSEAQQTRLRAAYRRAIVDIIIPTHQKLHAFIAQEYLPITRDSAGYGALPDGAAWYQYWIKEHTTTDMQADEIHALGLRQVARILREMDDVRKQVGFEGDLPAFLQHMSEADQFYFSSSEEVIQAYQAVRTKIEAALPHFFDLQPKIDYEIRPVEVFRAASAAGAYYSPGAPDGSRPGIFYINTYNLKAQPKFILETLSIHEASPGHHFQNSIQIELAHLPRIRRFGGNTAFEEGWALYAEYLGKEMGMFSDPYQYFGRLSDEMLRAMRLVVDTGLHARGWTREQAVGYMQENSSMADSDIIAEVERYMAIPGQALAYKVGELKIRSLREYAERELGDKFDVKIFHRQVLASGNIPMAVLENKIHAWVEAMRRS